MARQISLLKRLTRRCGWIIFLIPTVVIESVAYAFASYIVLIILSIPLAVCEREWFLFVVRYGMYPALIGGVLHTILESKRMIDDSKECYERYLDDIRLIKRGVYHRERAGFWEYVLEPIRQELFGRGRPSKQNRQMEEECDPGDTFALHQRSKYYLAIALLMAVLLSIILLLKHLHLLR